MRKLCCYFSFVVSLFTVFLLIKPKVVFAGDKCCNYPYGNYEPVYEPMFDPNIRCKWQQGALIDYKPITCPPNINCNLQTKECDPNALPPNPPPGFPTAGPSPTTAIPYPTIDIHGKCGEDITTALGCVPVGKFSDFVGWLLKRLIGIAGGIAFLLVVFGGLKILTSAGNPKGIQSGGEMISSALIGLLFIIFSVFLLELIGVKILGIPGL